MNRHKSLLAASAAFGVLFPKTYKEMSTPNVSHYSICSDLLPDIFDGFRIIHLSDLHNKVFDDSNARLIAMIEAEEPDIIIMTGDMISHSAPNTEQFLTLVKNLRKLCPVYYVNGNHELSDLEDDEFERVQNVLAEYGAVCLDIPQLKFTAAMNTSACAVFATLLNTTAVYGSTKEAGKPLC